MNAGGWEPALVASVRAAFIGVATSIQKMD